MTQTAHAKARIVVGVDGSPQSRLALRWAAYMAEKTGAAIDVVTVWEIPSSYGWTALPTTWNPQEDAENALAETLADVFGDRCPPDLRRTVCEGDAARALLSHSRGATMLVVGSRGHGGFTGLLIGSVSAKCAEHATCPVLVVHGGEGVPPA